MSEQEPRRMPEIDHFRHMSLEAKLEFLYSEVVRLHTEDSSLRRDVLSRCGPPGRKPDAKNLTRRKRGRRQSTETVGEQSA